MSVRTTVEAVEQHKVKLHVEIAAADFAKDVDAAFHKLASEVRIPGFRRGKVPRRVLETRLGGTDVLREQALKDALPGYCAEAIKAESIDAISVPEIDNVSAEEGADVSFDAVIEVRPKVDLSDWKALVVNVSGPTATDEEIDEQVNRLRQQFAELEPVGRPAQNGDFVSIDIKGTRHSEEVPGSTASDLLYEVGTGGITEQLDTELVGKRPGDILKFNDELPEAFGEQAGEEITFSVLVKEVSTRLMPELTDEWVEEVSEFATLYQLKADLGERIGRAKSMTTVMEARDAVVDALAERVTVDLPESMVGEEMQQHLQQFLSRMHRQNIEFAQYLEATGETQEQFIAGMRARAERAVKADLALRAIAEAEGLEADPDDVEHEVAHIAERSKKSPDEIRSGLSASGAWDLLRSDIVKRAALEFAVRSVEIKADDGAVLDIDQLLRPPQAVSPHEHGDSGEGDPPSSEEEDSSEDE